MTLRTLPTPSSPPAIPTLPAAPSSRGTAGSSSSIGIVAAMTLAIWMFCLAVGIWGLWLQYPGARIPPADTPVVARIIHIDLAEDSAPSSDDAGPSAPAPPTPDNIQTPPPLFTAAAVPDAAPLTAVAIPDPAIAFAKPVEGPSRIVDAKLAAPASPAPANAAPAPTSAGPAVHHLVYGKGEGAQPKPEYPREAILADQEGVVGVRFTVGADGRVLSADLISASRWPMLNQAALRAVRDRWRFTPGEPRIYEVNINYQLAK